MKSLASMWQCGPVYSIWPGREEKANGPVILSVPHAGRHYAPAILSRCRVPMDMLMRLEDRYADLLVEPLLDVGYPALIAHLPRAVIDMNRNPKDIDPRMIADMPRHQPLIQTSKQRAGLGLFPHSLHRCGGLWRGAMPWAEAESRIVLGHGAYHAQLGKMLGDGLNHHETMLLVDVHSMPPLSPTSDGRARPDIVIGDLHGASSSARYSEIALSTAEAHGMKAAHNHPYAGSYVLERHGAPRSNVHAIQVEVSRDLYLDDDWREPAEGLHRVQAMLSHMVDRLSRAIGEEDWACAAE